MRKDKKMFKYKRFEKEFEKRKKEMQSAYQRGYTYKTICYLRYLTNFCHQINYKMQDDILEDITEKVAHDLLGTTNIEKPKKKTVVFYDMFATEFRGLANIYINALEKLGFEIVWVIYEYGIEAEQIKEKNRNRKNISIVQIPKQPILDNGVFEQPIISRMRYLQKIIKEYAPAHIFIYTTPDDVAGIGVMSTIRGEVTRYLIDLTDHAFWLGKCATDYIIGFRNYGFNIAVQYRKFNEKQVLILPYYPNQEENYEFAGLPFDETKYSFVFSGGSLYKIEGDSAYEGIVVEILEKYPELYFVYAGNGQSQKLEKIKRKFPTRFFHIQERKDLNQILQRAKFYLGTYPIGGGLMTQFVLQNKCILLQLCNDKGGLTDPATYLLQPDKINCTFYNKYELLKEVDRLMADEQYYSQQKRETSNQIITRENFQIQLKNILTLHESDFKGLEENINLKNFLFSYKKRATYQQYCELIYTSRNKWIWNKHPYIVKKMKKLGKKDEC